MSSVSRHYMSKKQRACDACRVRKRACRIDGDAPCDFCFRFGKRCVFTDSTNRRKLKPSGAPADNIDLDPQLRMAASNNPGPGDADEGASTGLLSFQPTAGESLRTDNPAFDGGSGDFAMADFGPHAFFGLEHTHFGDEFALNQFGEPPWDGHASPTDSRAQISGLDKSVSSRTQVSLDADMSTTSQFIGHTSDMDPYLLEIYRYDEDRRLRFKKLTIQALDQGQIPIQFLLSDRGKLSSSEGHFAKELEEIVSQENGDRLIKLYHKYISGQFPIFPESPSAKTAPSYLLAAIYLTVQPYILYDEQLCIELAYEGLPRQQLLDLFYHSLGLVIARPAIATVQALFLMVIYPGDPLIFEGPSRWTMFGTLVSCAQTVGLHLDPTTWNLAPGQLTLRRTLSALIYSTDRLLAASFGKPPLLRLDNWLVTTLKQDDPIGPYHTSLTVSGLALHIQASSILDKTLVDLYSLRAISELGTDPWSTLEKARPILEELKSWHRTFVSTTQEHSIPSPFSNISSSTNTDSRDHPVYELGYHFVRILILRAVFRPFVSQQDPHTTPTPSYSEARSNARLGIRACTTDALQYIRSLRQEDAPYTFWPPWASGVVSSLCYLLLLMVATAHSYDDAAEWLRELQALRTELRTKSVGFPVLRLGLLRIDSIFWKDIAKVLTLSDHVAAALRDAEGSAG